jgi:N,N'-diacetyllegionaminate synthase
MTCNVIAEIGWNHMGDMVLAKEMVFAASEAGADFAKFQTWSVDNLKSGPWDDDGRLEIYKKAGLSIDQHVELVEYCDSQNIKFLTSIFNVNDADWLPKINKQIIKVPSHEVYNQELMSKIDGIFDTILVSTGAANWSEVEVIPLLIKSSKLSLLHCVSAYPCPPEKVNLPRINELKKINKSVGYSGHFFGIDDAVASVSYGVDFIEKHFTIDRKLPGRDNQFAILPEQMKTLTDYCKNSTEMNLNIGLELQDCEQDIVDNYRGRWSL